MTRGYGDLPGVVVHEHEREPQLGILHSRARARARLNKASISLRDVGEVALLHRAMHMHGSLAASACGNAESSMMTPSTA